MIMKRFVISFAAISCIAVPTTVDAQTYCALRDPVKHIYVMFPEATSYRSIVKTVGDEAREMVKKRLPFDLHFNELGRHTLYVPVKGDTPLGVVHVRSEASKWGMVEIAWAFDTDLRVKDFRFQRCRDPKRKTLESAMFRARIKGADFSELKDLFRGKSKNAKLASFKISKKTDDLSNVVIRSALKTMVVTEVVWTEDLRTISLLARSKNSFPEVDNIVLVDHVYTPNVIEKVTKRIGSKKSSIIRETVQIVRLTNGEKKTLGFCVKTDLKAGDYHDMLWWVLDANAAIVKVESTNSRIDLQTKRELEALAGRHIKEESGCATVVEMAAAEVQVVCQSLLK